MTDDIYKVKRITGPIDWETEVPGSKSITNRALLLAALSDGKAILQGMQFSEDAAYFLEALQRLGFCVRADEDGAFAEIHGMGGTIPNAQGEIYVGSAGTAARFLTAMLAASDGTYVVNASEQMKKRPMKPLLDALVSFGAAIEHLEAEGCLPVKIQGAGKAIRERGSATEIFLDISDSTQFLSALLLTAPMYPYGLDIHIVSKKTAGSYIGITRQMMASFGVELDFDGKTYRIPAGTSYKAADYRIEPDVSAACYFYAAAAITGGKATIKHIHKGSLQGDLKFLDVLEEMGCKVSDLPGKDGITVEGPAEGKLKGIEVDMNDFSDQALTLAAVAPFASSPVKILHIGHIRKQESDRIHAISSNLMRAGIRCDEGEDSVTVYPGTPKPCQIETFEDHRVAMAFSLLGLKADGIEIVNPGCCRKTFKNYFELLDKLSAECV